MSPDTIVEVWKNQYELELSKVTWQGFKTLLSSCWYLSDISYGIDWPKYYTCDPHEFIGINEASMHGVCFCVGSWLAKWPWRQSWANACLPVSWASDFCMVDLGVRNMYLPCMDFKRSYHWRLIQEYFRCLQFYHEQCMGILITIDHQYTWLVRGD